MVSFKSLTLLTLSISAVTAVPQFGHQRFHYRRSNGGISLPQPVVRDVHTHNHNESEVNPAMGGVANGDVKADAPELVKKAVSTPCTSTVVEYVTSTDIATVTAPARRWDHSRSWWGGQNTYTQPQANTVVPVASQSAAASYSAGDNTGATATASAAAATGSTSTTDTGASSGGKKGLSYNTNTLLNQFSAAGASWAYNWASGSGGSVPSGVEYVPMLWGSNSIPNWSADVKKAIAAGAKHALSFNEPDFPEQANMDAATAAKLHIANMAPLSGQIKVGSPAMTNSNIAGQGLDWMKSFLAACGGSANTCKIDFLAFHWYNNPGTIDNFKSHVQSVISLAKQNGIPKVWLTEFAVNGAASDQATFLAQALPYLDSLPEVERYAYFMVGNGQMLTNNALNVVGKAYAG